MKTVITKHIKQTFMAYDKRRQRYHSTLCKIKCRQNMTAHLAKIKRRPTLFKLTRNTSSKLDRVNEQCTHVGITIIH